MRILRYEEKGEKQWGWMHNDLIGPIDGDPFSAYRRMEANTKPENVKILPPCQPSKIICVGRNYASHAAEHDVDVPEIPLLFLKPPSSLLPTEGTILLPPQSTQVEHEAELAIVIGKQIRWVTPEEVTDVVIGYTIANDVTARDLQRKDGQWTRGKSFDTFCPIGPWIETGFDPADALLTCRVNGEVRQMASTRDMVFPVVQIVAFASSIMTLYPGDLILTGTPAGVGILKDGDTIEIEIEGIGSLVNMVKTEVKH